MKLGDKRSDATMEIIAPYAFTVGRCRLKHPRCGWVELERREATPTPSSQEKTFYWEIIAIEKPDKD